jgi:hypothetical protein
LPTSGGSSVGIVPSRAQVAEFSFRGQGYNFAAAAQMEFPVLNELGGGGRKKERRRALARVYNTQHHSVSGLPPSFVILTTRKNNVSETGPTGLQLGHSFMGNILGRISGGVGKRERERILVRRVKRIYKRRCRQGAADYLKSSRKPPRINLLTQQHFSDALSVRYRTLSLLRLKAEALSLSTRTTREQKGSGSALAASLLSQHDPPELTSFSH